MCFQVLSEVAGEQGDADIAKKLVIGDDVELASRHQFQKGAPHLLWRAIF